MARDGRKGHLAGSSAGDREGKVPNRIVRRAGERKRVVSRRHLAGQQPCDGNDVTHGPLLLDVLLLESIRETSFATDGFSATFKTLTGRMTALSDRSCRYKFMRIYTCERRGHV